VKFSVTISLPRETKQSEMSSSSIEMLSNIMSIKFPNASDSYELPVSVYDV